MIGIVWWVDTARALAQTVPLPSSPVSFETAVFGFGGAVAFYIGRKLQTMDEKLSQTLTLLHGVPEQQGAAGLVSDVKELKATARRVEGVHDHHLQRIEKVEHAVEHVEKLMDKHYGTGE